MLLSIYTDKTICVLNGEAVSALSNLKPWPKGVSGNPLGTSKLSAELKAIKALNKFEVARFISKYARMGYAQLKDFLEFKAGTAIELSIASIFLKAIDDADFTRLSFLLDRAIGKVAELPEEQEDERLEELRKLPIKDIIKLIQKTEE